MSEFDLSQKFVDRVTTDTIDEPPVIGAGRPNQAWEDAYVARMVEQGIPTEDARACCEAGEHDYSGDPREAADDEMSVWTDDGDEP